MTERPPLLTDLVRMVVKMIVGGILIILLFSCGVGVVAGAGAGATGGKGESKEPVSDHLYGEKDSDNAIMRVDITGPILTHKTEEDSFFAAVTNVTYGYEVKEKLLEAAENDDIKAVMLFVTTPGGSIVGSQAIHDGVLAVKEAGKPVVAYIDTVSASGGVWSTAAADKIFSDYGSIIGSVGVNFGNWMYFDDPVALDAGLFGGGVETRGGVRTQFLGAGLGKDLGNPWRPMTEREQRLLNSSAEFYYDAFVDHVVSNRPVDRDRLVNEYGAMVFADGLAQERGYIDDVKTYQETLRYIAEEIGAEGDDWKLITPPYVKKSPFEDIFGATLQALSPRDPAAEQRAAHCAELTGRPVIMTAEALNSYCGL